MTHYLENFTELLPQLPDFEALKTEFLRDAEATGMIAYLRARAITPEKVEERIEDEVSFLSAHVGSILEQRGLVEPSEVDELADGDRKPSLRMRAALKDAVEVSFVHDAALSAFKEQERMYLESKKTCGPNDEVRQLVVSLAEKAPVLAGPPTPHALDEMIAEVHAFAPWMSDLSTWIYKSLRAQYNAGETWLNLPPVILIGPPGCGKSSYARKLAALSGAPFRALDAAASSASFSVAGCDAIWGRAQAGVPLQEIAKRGIANPVMVVDEIDKAGIVTSRSGSNHSLPDAMLGLLEPSTSTAWECPYTRRSFNMSQINWIVTANEGDRIPVTLLDRCRVFEIGYPGPQELADLIRKRSEGRVYDEAVDYLIARVVDAVAKGHAPSLRRIVQVIDEASVVACNPVLH